jgi:hypothetical protein
MGGIELDGDTPVAGRVRDGGTDGVRVGVRVADGVIAGVGVLVRDAVADGVRLPLRAGEGVLLGDAPAVGVLLGDEPTEGVRDGVHDGVHDAERVDVGDGERDAVAFQSTLALGGSARGGPPAGVVFAEPSIQ